MEHFLALRNLFVLSVHLYNMGFPKVFCVMLKKEINHTSISSNYVTTSTFDVKSVFTPYHLL